MLNPIEAKRLAKSASGPDKQDLDKDFGDSLASVEARIDEKLRQSAEGGSAGCYIETAELGNDPEAIIKRYRDNGWYVEFMDKAGCSWLFQPKNDDTSDEW